VTRHRRWRTTQSVQQRARELRREQTSAEKMLWAELRRKQLYDLKFRRQHPIGTFIVDFCCVAKKLVVEVDGDSHAGQAEYDRARTFWIEEKGYRVIRFTNEEVHQHLDAVLDEIACQCGVAECGPLPNPPPCEKHAQERGPEPPSRSDGGEKASSVLEGREQASCVVEGREQASCVVE